MQPAKSRIFRSEMIISAVLLAILSALAYLPLASRMGFFNDDWYLIYSGYTQGVQKFSQIFAIDRPARAYLVSAVYSLFGTNAPLYSYSAYVIRLLGAYGLLWLFRMVWPKQRLATLMMAALFVVYPGFLDQPNAFDYQSHLTSFTLAIFSIAFTVRAVTSTRTGVKWIFTLLSVLFAAAYLLLMEYYIGLEAFRFFLIWYLTPGRTRGEWARRLGQSLLRFLPYLLTAGGFMVWRTFFFNNQRAATDIGSMFSGLASSPVMRGLWSLVYLVQDFLNVVLFAWAVPAYQMAFRLRLRDFLTGLGFAVAAVLALAAAWAFFRWIKTSEDDAIPPANESRWFFDAMWLGGLMVFFSLVPVVLGDRHIVFPAYGRFSLMGSIGAAMMLVGFLWAVTHTNLRLISIAGLVGIAVLTHFANYTNYALEWQSVKDFWWQVSWRAPQIKAGTTLVANYPVSGIAEDYFVWGPANLIYYPEKKTGEPTPISLPAAVLTTPNVQNILVGSKSETVERRSLLVTRDFGDTLTLSMPSSVSCVHAIDGRQVELSDKEEFNIMLVSPYSHLDAIEIDASPVVPPEVVFGPEPQHDWCYYYEKASLARQRGDWAEVVRLGDEAIEKGLHPNDWVEWMPFIEGYAYNGEEDKVRALVPILGEVPYLKAQACGIFKTDAYGAAKQSPEQQKLLIDLFCD